MEETQNSPAIKSVCGPRPQRGETDVAKRQMLRLLCAEEDRQSLQPVLDALRARGIGISEDPGGKGMLLAALSGHLYTDENLKKTLLEAISAGAESVLPLRLDKAELPPEIQTALYARNIIPANERSAEQTAGRIAAALPEKKRPTGRLLIAGAVVLALLAALLIWRTTPKAEPEPAAPAMAQEIPITEGWGLSEADLANICSVVIIGDEYHFIQASTQQPGQAAPSVFDYAVDNPDGDGWYSKADGHEYRLTRYDDLRFLALMPKLQCLSFARSCRIWAAHSSNMWSFSTARSTGSTGLTPKSCRARRSTAAR